MPGEEDCILGQLNKQRIGQIEHSLKDIHTDVKYIKDTLLKRPSWTVTIIMTVLLSLIGTLTGLLMKG